MRGIVVSMVGVWLMVDSLPWRLPAKKRPQLVDVKVETTNSLGRSRWSIHAFAALTTPSPPFWSVCNVEINCDVSYHFPKGCGACSSEVHVRAVQVRDVAPITCRL
jgi:hypothetical protein